MKIISLRLSDRDLRNLDLLRVCYYGTDYDNINLPLSPVIRACIRFAFDQLINDPDFVLSDSDFGLTDSALPDGSGVAGSGR